MALDLYTFVSPKGNIGIYDFAQENCEKKLYFRLPIEETFRLLLESIDIFVTSNGFSYFAWPEIFWPAEEVMFSWGLDQGPKVAPDAA